MDDRGLRKIRVVDSHTGGEPTRVVIEGGPDLGPGGPAAGVAAFREHHDGFRSAVVNEPRGSDVLVGALLCGARDPAAAAGVIFFNNVGYLGMCGHGTIGLMATLNHLGRVGPGVHRLETPVGTVKAALHPDGGVTVENVPSYRLRKGVTVEVEGRGAVTGDVAWGGNWFFLVEDRGLLISPRRIPELTDLSWRIRRALEAAGVRGEGGAEIDHIELCGPTDTPGADGRNFVLCPGGAYDRSPCGTGTSAHLACLAADGHLREGQVWRQESVIGSLFEGSVRIEGDRVVPSITGRAHITGEATLLVDPEDPFAFGVRL